MKKVWHFLRLGLPKSRHTDTPARSYLTQLAGPWPRLESPRRELTLSFACAKLSPRPNHTVSIDVEAVFGKFNAMTSEYLVELPGIEPDALRGIMHSELPVRSISFRFSPVRYLRLRSRVLTASRAVITCPYPTSGATGHVCGTNRHR